jgi:hypothetical protein
LVTGLIGALLSTFFRIQSIRAWNPKSPVLRGGKPTLLFPFGWQIVFQMGWSRGKPGKRPVIGVGGLSGIVKSKMRLFIIKVYQKKCLLPKLTSKKSENPR